ncbi:HNH endonuclease [Roseomonas sp. BN140053]|uniref:HNH endonuclease n=1 Tax=Roseomonas sp. BN140053 TaxID=3391898 RepID=UPI0039ED9138
MKDEVAARLAEAFGPPARDVQKVKSWTLTGAVGVVLQVDQPNRENAAYVWLPYPGDGQAIPEIAAEYPGEAGRHSGTYATPGLRRGDPALKLTLRDPGEVADVVAYLRAMAASAPLPEVRARPERAGRIRAAGPGTSAPGHVSDTAPSGFIDPASMPLPEPVKPRREAIPRVVQREVWQRDGGRCVECSTREKLCFDHIVPFSLGGSNTVRNIQLLCEGCNLSKSNRI